MGKRVIEETASNVIFNDDWFLKDSPTQGTTKLSGSDLKSIMNTDQAKSADLADAYDPNHNYVEGDVCIHDDTLHKANDDTTGTWDSTKWESTTIAEIIATIDLSAEAISYDNTSSGLEAENVQNAIDETITKLSAVGSASGAIATFSDGSDLAMKSLKVAIEPQQDLHGYEAPWVGGAGKNKLPMTVEGIKAVNTYHSWSGNSTTINNVTITIETDENNNVTGIKFNGTASADITFNLASNITISNGSYIWSNDQTVNISNLWLSLTSPNIAITLSTQKEVNVTVSSGSIGSAYIYASSGNVFNNIVFKPMIRLASVSDSTFAPYSNICPISGFTEMNVTRTGKNLIPTGTSTTKGYVDNSYLNADGTIGSDNTLFISEYFKVPSDVDCAWSSKNAVIYNLVSVCFYDKNKNYISGTALAKATKIITTPSNATYCRSTQSKNENNKFQFEIGSTATTYSPYNGNTYTIDLDGTRYGGTLDVVSGVMTVDRGYMDMGDLNYILGGGGLVFYSSIPSRKTGTIQIISDSYKYIGNASDSTVRDGDDGVIATEANSEQIKIKDTRFDSASAIKQAMASHKIIYPLATPINIQLTPTQVKSLLGVNNVWADCGDVDVSYVRDLTTTINYILEQLNS